MTAKDVKAALEAVLALSLAGTPIAWPNVDFEPTPDTTWVRPVNKPGTAFEGEVGTGGLSRRTGAFIVQIFVPSNKGSGAALAVAATLEAAFRRQSISGVECGEAYTSDVGDSGANQFQADVPGWYQVNIVVPWWAWIGE